MHDSRGPDGKRGPSRQDLRAVYSQTAVCRAFRTHGARILPKPAHFGCMAAISCREPALFPPEAPSGTHGAKKLPRLTAREYATAKWCHGSPPGNASRRYLAKTGSPGTHRGDILPLSDAGGGRISRTFRHRRAPGNAPRRYFGIATMFGNAQRRYVATARRRRRRPKRRAALSTGVGPNRWKSTRLKSAALSTRGSGLESLTCVWASARNTFYASMRLCVRSPVRLCACARRGDFALSELNCWERL